MKFIKDMSPAEREEFLSKARIAKEAKKQSYLDNYSLKQDWSDRYYWHSVVSSFNVRMPASYLPLEKKRMKQYLKKFGKDVKWFTDHFNTQLDDYIKYNISMPLWVFVGMIAEECDC